MTKKSIPKRERRCSNSQVEPDERKKETQRYCDFKQTPHLLQSGTSGTRCQASDTVTTGWWINVDRNKHGKIHSELTG